MPFAEAQSKERQAGASLGFSEAAVLDAEQEHLSSEPLPLPQEVEEGLWQPGASPTEVELRHKRGA